MDFIRSELACTRESKRRDKSCLACFHNPNGRPKCRNSSPLRSLLGPCTAFWGAGRARSSQSKSRGTVCLGQGRSLDKRWCCTTRLLRTGLKWRTLLSGGRPCKDLRIGPLGPRRWLGRRYCRFCCHIRRRDRTAHRKARGEVRTPRWHPLHHRTDRVYRRNIRPLRRCCLGEHRSRLALVRRCLGSPRKLHAIEPCRGWSRCVRRIRIRGRTPWCTRLGWVGKSRPGRFDHSHCLLGNRRSYPFGRTPLHERRRFGGTLRTFARSRCSSRRTRRRHHRTSKCPRRFHHTRFGNSEGGFGRGRARAWPG